MHRRFCIALGTAVILIAFSGVSASAKKKNAGQAADFSVSISKDQKVEQALNRLTFGPRPGDVKSVKSMGLKKWIDQQLYPERITESPKLEAKLKWLDSLRMSQSEM